MSEELEKKDQGNQIIPMPPMQEPKSAYSEDASSKASTNEAIPVDKIPEDAIPVDAVPVDETLKANKENAVDAETVSEGNSTEKQPESGEPQVIIQKEKGFTYYVGFALLFVLGVILFFTPGMAVSFGVNKLVALPCVAAWIFTAVISIILWVVFKVKIKGFKKSFYWYLGLCGLIVIAFVAIDFAVQGHGLKSLFDMMVGNTPVAQVAPAAPVNP